MPNFTPRPRGLMTPPGSGQIMYGYHRQGQFGQGRKSAYESNQYVAPNAPHAMYQQPPMQYNNNNMPQVPLPPGMQQHQSYGPIAAPILPSINDRNADISAHSQSSRRERHEQRRTQQPAAKEQKVTGGVAQELDYEMDQMTDYVSDMAQSIVMPRSKVSPAFRKFVSGLLSSTRLPSSTILLGLNYLARRMSMLNNPTPRKTTDGQVWRMLTISLLLGSKFLDDNTFQNRSWSEVSGISVTELNTLEKEWLDAIEWNLHVDFFTDTDYQSWMVSWESWRDARNLERSATLERLAPLAPIDTNVQRQQQPQRKAFSPTTYPSYGQSSENQLPSYQSQQARYEQPPAWSRPTPANELSPPSAPESGPNTPEWMMLPGLGLPPAEWYGYNSFYARRNHQSTQMPYVPAQVAPYHTPFHNNYPQGSWGHPAGCGCHYCGSNDSYFRTSSYGPQTVAG